MCPGVLGVYHHVPHHTVMMHYCASHTILYNVFCLFVMFCAYLQCVCTNLQHNHHITKELHRHNHMSSLLSFCHHFITPYMWLNPSHLLIIWSDWITHRSCSSPSHDLLLWSPMFYFWFSIIFLHTLVNIIVLYCTSILFLLFCFFFILPF